MDGVLVVTPVLHRGPPRPDWPPTSGPWPRRPTLPVVLYDIPVRAGRKIAHDTMIHLARDVPNIVGVKDAAGDVPARRRWWPRLRRDSSSTAATTH